MKVLKFGQLPPEPESQLLINAKKILDIYKAQGLLSYRRIHVMPIVVGKNRTRPNIEMKGMEDLQIYVLHGKTLFRELKSKSGKQSPLQKEREKELNALGHDYAVWRSLDDIIGDLRRQGLSLWCFPS